MSDTDDTDDLLLIPPDFFVIESDSADANFVEPYYNIVDNLIQQVSALQDRIDSIESVSLSNPVEFWFDHSDNMQDATKFQKYDGIDELYNPQSTQSTPQKPHTKFKLSSLPNSPNLDKLSPSKNIRFNKEIRSQAKVNMSPRSNRTRRSTVSSSPDKSDEHTLGEIDTFLSRVKTIQRISAARNLEKDFNHGDVLTNASNNNNEIHQLLSDLSSKPTKNNPLENKEERLSPRGKDVMLKEHTWRQGDNKESVPDYGAGIKNVFYTKIEDKKSRGDYNRQNKATQDSFSDTSSELTLVTTFDKSSKDRGDLLNSPIHSKALHLLNVHKQLLDEAQQINQKNKSQEPKPRGANTINDNYGLLSLADIWSNNPQMLNLNASQLSQKLQEEKLRRQHCEELIQKLQNRNLELQQKLTVALRVDESKNTTIHQFQEVLEKIIARIEKLNAEKQEWDQERTKLKATHSMEMEEATQRVSYYEKEASKALNLAHGNQDKLSSLEKRCTDLQKELQSIEKRCKDIEDDYGKEVERNKELSDILSRKESELNENKNILKDARGEVAQSKRAVETCQAEFAGIKNECARLQSDLKKEREQISQYNEQRRSLLNDMEGHKRREEELETQCEKLKKQLENSKLELRHFYQGQVEILVQNKLKEFQSQLDQAESVFKEELKKREMSLAKTAATHIQQISEKYSLEIKLLEKKHEEEMKLYQIQVMQQKQHAESLQSKLDQMQERRVQVAKQLQKIMESQWTEALRIITSGKSPVFNENTFSTIDQLNSLKTKSYNNVEEVLSQQPVDHHKKPKNESAFSSTNVDTLSSVSNNFDRNPRDDSDDTPVSSRVPGHKLYHDNEIQKYMCLLLNRPPNPVQAGQHRLHDIPSPENVTDRASWQHVVRRNKRK